MDRVLKCDGYEMFHGSFQVNGIHGAFRVSGDWLHIPKWKNDGYDIWYVQPKNSLSRSFDASDLSDMRLEDD